MFLWLCHLFCPRFALIFFKSAREIWTWKWFPNRNSRGGSESGCRYGLATSRQDCSNTLHLGMLFKNIWESAGGFQTQLPDWSNSGSFKRFFKNKQKTPQTQQGGKKGAKYCRVFAGHFSFTGIPHFLNVHFLTFQIHFNYTQKSFVQHMHNSFNLCRAGLKQGCSNLAPGPDVVRGEP